MITILRMLLAMVVALFGICMWVNLTGGNGFVNSCLACSIAGMIKTFIGHLLEIGKTVITSVLNLLTSDFVPELLDGVYDAIKGIVSPI